MDSSTLGWLGGIIGGVLGLVGGVIGSYFSIRNTKGPRERSFVVKFVLLGWIAIMVFLLLLFTLPGAYKHLLWIPYVILLPVSIRYGNRRQQAIRETESET